MDFIPYWTEPFFPDFVNVSPGNHLQIVVQYVDAISSAWFVLRDLSRANAKIPGYKILEEEGVRFFTPMHTVVKEVHIVGASLKVTPVGYFA